MWVTENPPFNLFSVKHGSRIPGGCCRYILTDFSTSPIPLPLPSCTFEMGTECVRKKRKRWSVCGALPPPSQIGRPNGLSSPLPNKRMLLLIAKAALFSFSAVAISAPPPKKAATHKKTFPPLQAAQQRKFTIKAREDGGKMMSVGGEALIWVSPLPAR